MTNGQKAIEMLTEAESLRTMVSTPGRCQVRGTRRCFVLVSVAVNKNHLDGLSKVTCRYIEVE